MSTLKVIVNADDFGKSSDVNKKIEFCHQHGVLSSASLVANGESFDEALEIARNNPKLGIGVHLSIDDFEPFCCGPSSIVNPKTNKFYPPDIALKNITRFNCCSNDLVNEYSCQIEKVLNCSIHITHLDHHHEFNLYWPVLNAMIKVAKKYDIRQMRSEHLLLQEKQLLYKSIYRFIHQQYLMRRKVTIDGHLKFANSDFSKMYEKIIKLSKSTFRIVEIVVHPSTEKEYEVSFLTDPRVVSAFEKINLVNFGDI
jgi:chitin disaccharide deacetylase